MRGRERLFLTETEGIERVYRRKQLSYYFEQTLNILPFRDVWSDISFSLVGPGRFVHKRSESLKWTQSFRPFQTSSSTG